MPSIRKLMILGRVALVAAVAATGLLVTSAPAQAQSTPAARAASLPERLSDADFWRIEKEISEPGGYFRIEDNFTSNEGEVGRLFTMLRQRGITGGVYMGVGPEQNLSYIAATRPQMAFICDIRRQAVMQHLMFKAMFELSKDRADFISLLFSKPRPAGLDSTTDIQKMWEAYWHVATDTVQGPRNYQRIVDYLTRTKGFVFDADESAKLKAVWEAFYFIGPVISTNGAVRPGSSALGFADLTGYSYDDSGVPQSFLSTEDNYQFVKGLHDRNLIIPVSGDFGGPKAIRAIGEYVARHGATINAFYVSNVEQYLFGDGKNGAFYANVATLPVNPGSVFIRPYSMRRGGGGAIQSLCAIAPFIRAVGEGRVYSNNDALACPR